MSCAGIIGLTIFWCGCKIWWLALLGETSTSKEACRFPCRRLSCGDAPPEPALYWASLPSVCGRE